MSSFLLHCFFYWAEPVKPIGRLAKKVLAGLCLGIVFGSRFTWVFHGTNSPELRRVGTVV